MLPEMRVCLSVACITIMACPSRFSSGRWPITSGFGGALMAVKIAEKLVQEYLY